MPESTPRRSDPPPKRRVGYLGHGTGTRMRPTSLPGRWWVSFHLIPATRFVLRVMEEAGYLIRWRTRTVRACLSQSKCFRMRSSTGQIQHDKPKGGPICWTCNKLTQALIVIQLSHNHLQNLQKHAETMCSAKSATYEHNVKHKNNNKRWKWCGIPLNYRQQQVQYIAELQNEKADWYHPCSPLFYISFGSCEVVDLSMMNQHGLLETSPNRRLRFCHEKYPLRGVNSTIHNGANWRITAAFFNQHMGLSQDRIPQYQSVG